MKFYINLLKNSMTLLIIIFLILSIEIESKYRSISHLKLKRRSLNKSSFGTKNKVVPPFISPIGNLLAGIKNVFIPPEKGEDFFSCFPKKWRKGSTDKKKSSIFDKFTSFLIFLGKKIISFFPTGKIMEFICANRNFIMDKIKLFLPVRRLESESESKSKIMLSKIKRTHNLKRKFRVSEKWLLSIAKSVFSVAKKIYKVGKTIVKKGIEFIKNLAIKVFMAAKNFVITVVKSIATFFKDILFTFVNCFIQNPKLFIGTTFATIMMKLKSKFNKFQVATATGLTLVYTANTLIGFMCNTKEIKVTQSKLNEAFKAKTNNESALFLGEGLALLLKTFADSE